MNSLNSISSDSEIHVFEPNPFLQYYLVNSLNRNIKINEIALTNKIGELHFYEGYKSGHSGTSSMKINSIQNRNEIYRKVKVSATTLDQYVCSSNKAPTIIKVDIEDGEADFLAGSAVTLEKTSPVIILEIWNKNLGGATAAAVNKLSKLGYKIYKITETGDLILSNNIDDIFDRNQEFVNVCLKNDL